MFKGTILFLHCLDCTTMLVLFASQIVSPIMRCLECNPEHKGLSQTLDSDDSSLDATSFRLTQNFFIESVCMPDVQAIQH